MTRVRARLGVTTAKLALATATLMAPCAAPAFGWRTPKIVDLGTLGGTSSTAVAINDSGEIAGHSDTTNLVFHAYRWTRRGGMQDLGTLGGPSSFATAINNRGQITGQADLTGAPVIRGPIFSGPSDAFGVAVFGHKGLRRDRRGNDQLGQCDQRARAGHRLRVSPGRGRPG